MALPRWEKGTRPPNSGRKKGTPNRVSVELRTLIGELVTNPVYQAKLRRDFVARKLHPTIEALTWNYHLGKPAQPITMDARIDVTARIEEERRIFAALDFADLEQLAAESQALVDRAAALSRARIDGARIPQDVVGDTHLPEVSAETLGKEAGSDNQRYVPDAEPTQDGAITPADAEDSTGHAREDDDSTKGT